jgi:hypothetical protein
VAEANIIQHLLGESRANLRTFCPLPTPRVLVAKTSTTQSVQRSSQPMFSLFLSIFYDNQFQPITALTGRASSTAEFVALIQEIALLIPNRAK